MIKPATISYGFNPRSRMGSDAVTPDTSNALNRVSIHAPAWGATGMLAYAGRPMAVSIHAPAWGATMDSC